MHVHAKIIQFKPTSNTLQSLTFTKSQKQPQPHTTSIPYIIPFTQLLLYVITHSNTTQTQLNNSRHQPQHYNFIAFTHNQYLKSHVQTKSQTQPQSKPATTITQDASSINPTATSPLYNSKTTNSPQISSFSQTNTSLHIHKQPPLHNT